MSDADISHPVCRGRARDATLTEGSGPEPVYGALRVGLLSTSLGAVLLALSPHGVAALFPGDDADALRRELRRRYRFGKFEAPDADFTRTSGAVVSIVEGRPGAVPIPLDLRGTPFRLRVWRALIGIPAGETASYRDIARMIGAPGASRAVAGACAANPVAVIVPCHRVVRANGDLSGYRWGAARKSMLLARERATPASASSHVASPVWPE
jgi:AraC family transcriptional regulator of adaptative response/methylated-DNA-[protein]-cysteine methyltransferase